MDYEKYMRSQPMTDGEEIRSFFDDDDEVTYYDNRLRFCEEEKYDHSRLERKMRRGNIPAGDRRNGKDLHTGIFM